MDLNYKIMIKKIFYTILFTFSLITVNAQSIGLVGAFNNWGGTPPNSTDVVMNTTDNITYTLQNFALLANSEMKFRQDGAWAINWGLPGFPSGVGIQDGPNIIGLAGTYNITFNITTGAYSFVAVPVNNNLSQYATIGRTNGESISQFADLNSDGKIDIITIDNSKLSRFYINTGTGYSDGGSLQLPAYASPVAMKDFDNDGKIDLLSNSINGNTCLNNLIRIYWNSGTAGSLFSTTTFTELPLPTGNYCMQSKEIDFNGDGKMDVIATSMQGQSRTYKNNGNRNFTVQANFQWPRDLYYTHTKDYNGDGNADFLSIGKSGWADSLYGNYFYRGNGDGTFQAPIINFATQRTYSGTSINLEPLNNNIEDYGVYVGTAISQNFQLAKWNGTNNFNFSTIAIPTNYTVIQSSDYDFDGYQDLILLSQTGTSTLKFMKNNGAGIFNSNLSDIVQNSSFTLNGIANEKDADNSLYIHGSNTTQLIIYKKSSNLSTPTISSFSPINGCAGTSVTITGTNFTGATAVSFGGTAAVSFTVVNATTIIAVIGTGTTGTIAVTTPAGNITSNSIFTLGDNAIAFAYVGNYNNNNVSVINATTNMVITTVAVGTRPVGVSVSPDSSKVYVLNQVSNNVSVINTATNEVTATITVGTAPVGVGVSPDANKVYVTNQRSNDVSVINTATNQVTATIPVGSTPAGVGVSPDGSKVYVAIYDSNQVIVINTITNMVTATIPVGTNPLDVCVSPDGSRVYVTNPTSNDVSVINTANNAVTATIQVGTTPVGLKVTPDGSKVYVTNQSSNNVSVINTASNAVTGTIQVGSHPTGLSVSLDGSVVYVANFNSMNLSIINVNTNSVTSTITVGDNPSSFGNFIANVTNPCISPTITAFTPTTSAAGTTVTITGTNFTGATTVSFGGTTASSFTVVNANTITAIVGSGASGSVSVTTPNGTASLSGYTLCNPITPTFTQLGPICSGGTSVTLPTTSTNGITGTW